MKKLNLVEWIFTGMFDLVFKIYYLFIFKKKERSFVNERPLEYGFVLSHLPITNEKLSILDVGSGKTSFPALLEDCNYDVTALEAPNSYWGRNITNRHFPLTYDDITKSKLKSSSYDVITCISVLEHIEEFNLAIKEMFRLLKPKGFLFLTFPYNDKDFIYDSHKERGSNRFNRPASYIVNIYSAEEVNKWCKDNNVMIEKQVFVRFWGGDFWNSGVRLPEPQFVYKDRQHDLTMLIFKKLE